MKPHLLKNSLIARASLLLTTMAPAQNHNPADSSGQREANPLGIFDFAFRGPTPKEKIQTIDGMGFCGIAMFLNGDNEIAKLEQYRAERPSIKLIAGLVVIDHTARLNVAQLERVIKKLSELDATLWLIMKGNASGENSVVKCIREVADLAAKGPRGIYLRHP